MRLSSNELKYGVVRFIFDDGAFWTVVISDQFRKEKGIPMQEGVPGDRRFTIFRPGTTNSGLNALYVRKRRSR